MENKNYYDWLEISKKASPEVIEKAYKALVKKYHPDLQEGNKSEAEDILKKINEAYDVLSDSAKREQYDATLIDDSVAKEDYDKLKQELNNLKQTPSQNNSQKHYTQTVNPNPARNTIQSDIDNQQQMEQERQRQAHAEQEYQRQVEAARRKAYHDAYIQDLRNRGYKIRYKKSFKDYIRIFVTFVIIVFVFWIALKIPFVQNWLKSIYNGNEIVRFFVDIIANMLNTFKENFR